jgi:hypothetical protein
MNWKKTRISNNSKASAENPLDSVQGLAVRLRSFSSPAAAKATPPADSSSRFPLWMLRAVPFANAQTACVGRRGSARVRKLADRFTYVHD